MPNFYTNVKSRLNKKGIKGLTKTDFLVAAEELGISDLDNATTEQIIAGVDYFVNKQSTELAPIESVNNLPVTTEKSNVNNLCIDVNSIDNDELTDTQDVPESTAIAPQESSQITVSCADKQSLVTAQSMALGFELSESETLAIADTVDDVFSDYSSFLNGVTVAIKQYVDHRFDDIESTLDNNTHAVREHIADRATRLNQKVENFSTNVRADIGGIRQQIKSSRSSILARFALPSKAG